MKKAKIQNTYEWLRDFNASPLNWSAEKRDIFDDQGHELPIMGMFRSDNDRFLGTVSNTYPIINNEELFKVPGSLSVEGSGTELIRSGVIDGGQTVYSEYKLPYQMDVGNVGDIIETSIISRTSHDGRGSLFFRINTKRLICTNGMTAIDRRSLAIVRHTMTAEEKIRQAQKVLAKASLEIKGFFELMNVLSTIKLSVENVRRVLVGTLGDEEGELSSIAQSKAVDILTNFEDNDGNTFKEQRNSAYSLLNAVTRFTDHGMKYRSKKDENDDDAKIRGILFGAGEALKLKALEEIVSMIREDHPTKNLPNISIIR